MSILSNAIFLLFYVPTSVIFRKAWRCKLDICLRSDEQELLNMWRKKVKWLFPLFHGWYMLQNWLCYISTWKAKGNKKEGWLLKTDKQTNNNNNRNWGETLRNNLKQESMISIKHAKGIPGKLELYLYMLR